MMNAMKRGFRLWVTHLPQSLAYILVVTAVMLMPVAPLLALLAKESWLHWAALLCVPMFVFLVLPMRRNAAAVLRHVCLGEGRMNDAAMISGVKYAAKLLHGLKVTLLLMLWALPGLAATAYCVYMFKGGADGITIIMSISRLGGGDLKNGIIFLLLIYAATWLPLFLGMMLHSGARHAWATGQKLPEGTRGKLYATWLCSLVIAIPCLIAVAVILKVGMAPIFTMVKTFQFEAALAQLKPMGIQLLIAFAVLLLPLVPLRHLMIAACIHQPEEKQA